MNWKLKAFVQRSVGAVPDAVSHPLYYALQRTLGGLRHPDPIDHFRGAIAMARHIRAAGHTLEGARVLEIGTGRQLNVPMALWLCGADSIVSVDLRRYLKEAIVLDNIAYVRAHRAAVAALFAGVAEPATFEARLDRLVAARTLTDVAALVGLRYEAPADATRLALDGGSVDFHTSFTVLEHVPPPTLERLFAEGRRVLAPSGLFVHYVDFSDHFSHADPRLTAVNFLRFGEREWQRLAGNAYAYHNRLRVDEFAAIVSAAGAGPIQLDSTVDERSVRALAGGLPLDPRFAGKAAETNGTVGAWVISRRG